MAGGDDSGSDGTIRREVEIEEEVHIEGHQHHLQRAKKEGKDRQRRASRGGEGSRECMSITTVLNNTTIHQPKTPPPSLPLPYRSHRWGLIE